MAQWMSASRRAAQAQQKGARYRTQSNPNSVVVSKESNSMKSKQSLSYRLGILLAIGGLCVILPSCVNKAQQNFERPPAPVVVSTAVSQDVSNYMDALGKIVARETVSIQPQV